MPQSGFISPTNVGIVPRPCTEQQTVQNWQNAADNIQNLQRQLGDPSVIPTVLAGLPGIPGLPGGPGTAGPPGASGTDGPAGAPGISLTDTISQILRTLQTIIDTISGGSGDDKFVAVNSGDTPGYLEDQLADNHVQASAQYNSTQDFLVESDTIDTAGDKKSRFFVDLSDFSGFSTTVRKALTISGGAPDFRIPDKALMYRQTSSTSLGTIPFDNSDAASTMTTSTSGHSITIPTGLSLLWTQLTLEPDTVGAGADDTIGSLDTLAFSGASCIGGIANGIDLFRLNGHAIRVCITVIGFGIASSASAITVTTTSTNAKLIEGVFGAFYMF